MGILLNKNSHLLCTSGGQRGRLFSGRGASETTEENRRESLEISGFQQPSGFPASRFRPIIAGEVRRENGG